MVGVKGTMKISAFSHTDYIPFRELFFNQHIINRNVGKEYSCSPLCQHCG